MRDRVAFVTIRFLICPPAGSWLLTIDDCTLNGKYRGILVPNIESICGAMRMMNSGEQKYVARYKRSVNCPFNVEPLIINLVAIQLHSFLVNEKEDPFLHFLYFVEYYNDYLRAQPHINIKVNSRKIAALEIR